MATPIHTELKTLAGGDPAAYLSVDFIYALTTKRLLIAADKLKGAEIPVGQRVLSASLESAAFAKPPITAARLIKYKTAQPNQIGYALNSDLTVMVNVFVKGGPTKLISTVSVVIKDIMLLGSYSANTLTFEGVDLSPSSTITRNASADKLLKDANIDPLEAARVEGLIAYSTVISSLSANLAQRKEISLSDVFPAFDFGTAAKLVPLSAGSDLGIIPSEFTRVETAACQCDSGPDLPVSGSSNTIAVPANPQVGTNLGGVTIGGPLAENIDPLKDLGRRRDGEGQAGVYLPRVAYSGLTVQVMPAIEIHASDDGFIGFDARATVAFSGLHVDLDAKNGGIIVSVNMDISVQATCTLDMGCGLRLPIGEALINQQPGSNANLTMGFYPALDQSGDVKLKGVLNNIDMGSYIAVIIGIGTALEIIGVTAWIGFLIDVVLSAIVSYELPAVLRDALKKYIGTNEWTLIRAGELLAEVKDTLGPTTIFEAPFDVDGNTLLASVRGFKQ